MTTYSSASVRRPAPAPVPTVRVVAVVVTLVAALVGLLVLPAGRARSEARATSTAGPTLSNPAVTWLPWGHTFTLTGTGAPGSLVLVHYHRRNTPPTDYSTVRAVSVDATGHWSRPAVLDTDYRAYVTAADGTRPTQTVLVAATPVVTSPPATAVGRGQPFTVHGRSAPGSVVYVRYHRGGTAPTDYGVVRPVVTGADGGWSRSAVLDVDYRVIATTTSGAYATPSVLFGVVVAAPGSAVLPTQSQQVMVAHRTAGTKGTWARYQWVAPSWVQVNGPATSVFGSGGVVPAPVRVQDTRTTPAGTFPIVYEFGPADPGTAMTYRVVDDCSWWVQDAGQPDYNRWREQCGAPSWLGEHLASYTSNLYRQAAVIGYNYTTPVHSGHGSGSGIFLHYATDYTGGCVAIDSATELTATMRWMTPAGHPTIVIS